MSVSSHADIIDLWRSAAHLAREIGVRPEKVRGWRRVNSIPDWYWKDLVASADRLGLQVTHEILLASCGAPRGKTRDKSMGARETAPSDNGG